MSNDATNDIDRYDSHQSITNPADDRPRNCDCWGSSQTLPCWPCYRAGIDTHKQTWQCDGCGEQSSKCYRCSECGKDLAGNESVVSQ